MKNARIKWNEGIPQSLDYKDNYFSIDDPIAEKSYVFLEQNNIPKAWRDKDSFIIAENGFGLGLNFLLVYKSFKENSYNCKKLTFFSYDLYPLTPIDLQRALSTFKELDSVIPIFLNEYKKIKKGKNTLVFEDGKIELILVIDEALSALKSFECRADVWFLDGFAPSKNSEIYRDEVLEQIASKSKEGTTFSTYSISGIIRRGMARVGFDIFKDKGHGQKKEMLRGIFKVS